MCRSKSDGGRRCPDRTTTHTGPTAPPSETASPSATGSAPDREQTDRLAAALPEGRTGWDGSPLDDAGRRLFALRESGYTGPIDRDGYPDTTSQAAGILRRMAQDRGETTDW